MIEQALRHCIDGRMETGEPILLAIDGDSAAGKSTLATALQQAYQCNVIHMDHFFLQAEQRTEARLAEPGGNVDYERFIEEVLTPLQAHSTFSYRPFDCKTMGFGPEITIRPHPLTVVEGAYSLHPVFGEPYHIKVFMTVDEPEQLRRIKARNGGAQIEQFQTKWIPMEKWYFSQLDIQARCDFVL
ncbi:MAG: hypothetical protein FWD99_05060 [Oscillospiraceae bacterium]|nr:hypothetical protein [Oscillospiraceae bacterium]